MDKRGQSALEYLMTYGWALIVIVVVIAALFVLINPGAVGGNQCTPTTPITIENHLVTQTGIQLVVSNGSGYNITTTSIVATGTIGGNAVSDTNSESIAIGRGSTTLKTTTSEWTSTGAVGDSYQIDVSFNYNDQDALARSVTTTCSGTV